MSEILFALRMYPSAKGKLAHEKYTGKEPNTIKKLVVNSFRSISFPPTVHLSDTDFESDQHSIILVRERTRGTKLERANKKRKGVLLEQSNHVITFLPAGRNQPTGISKRDVDSSINQPCCSREAAKQKQPQLPNLATQSDLTTTSETDTTPDWPETSANQQIENRPNLRNEPQRKKMPPIKQLKQ